jgi:DNA-binding MarR family transcriptional regulator
VNQYGFSAGGGSVLRLAVLTVLDVMEQATGQEVALALGYTDVVVRDVLRKMWDRGWVVRLARVDATGSAWVYALSVVGRDMAEAFEVEYEALARARTPAGVLAGVVL